MIRNSGLFLETFRIDGRAIGPTQPPYIIAELSANHKGDLGRAIDLIDAAAASGADAVKLQTYRPDTITLNHNGPEFRIEDGLWAGRTLFDLYEDAHTPWEWHKPLFERAKAHGITLFSSPFDSSAIELLEDLRSPAYKIASFEITDIGLIQRAVTTGKPIIISTGLATLDEIVEAVDTVRDAGGTQLALLHCISGYPTPLEDCNLRTITDLKSRFRFPVGLSDHTVDSIASITAVALGASIIEKHFTLDRNDGSVDAAFSLAPKQFKALVDESKRAWKSLGVAGYEIKQSEAGGREFRRSLYVSKPIKQQEKFTEDNIRSVRPGLGLHPRYYPDVLKATATQDLTIGTALSWEHIDKGTKT